MIQKEDETPEYFLEQFHYALWRSNFRLDTNTQNTLFLKGVGDECMEILNLMSGGDIYQEKFMDIKELYRRYSRGLARVKTLRDLGPRAMNTAIGGVSRIESGNILDNL